MTPQTPRFHPASGFSLIEMSIMLAVVGTILVSGIQAIQAQLHKSRFEAAQKQLRDIQSALLGFIQLNNRLPCPDTDFDGDAETSPCASPEGQLPWRDLQLSPLDPWGHLYTYRVTSAWTSSNITDGVGNGNITIQDANGNNLATQIPMVVLSHGRNGFGAMPLNGGTPLPAPTLPAELENTTPNGIFQFGGDDLMTWLPPDVIRYHAFRSRYTP
ncbi:MAG: type II secretion system protein [Magnetococcales bacterium]|nr:type II secretion system protein [Magnetococcales bacterium]